MSAPVSAIGGTGLARQRRGTPVSQPNFSDYQEPDPLQAFAEEARTAPTPGSVQPAEAVELVAKTADPPPPPIEDPKADFGRRLGHTERQIERALIDLANLKADLATLVRTVDDIKKRMGRPESKPLTVTAPPRRRPSGPRAIAAIVILLTVGAVLWGLVAAPTYDVPEPPVVESQTSSGGAGEAPSIATAESPPAPVVVQAAASAPPPRVAPAVPPRVVTYVGTLTVDADPAGDVYLNRKNVGRTPVRLENLRAGSHLIWIEREGYRRWTRVVAVAADRVSRVSASLDPLSR